MASQLAAFLSQAARRGFVWGDHDCMLFAADWAREVCGRDPAQHFRNAYATGGEAMAIMKGTGGPHALMSALLTAAGWCRVADAPREGDIVLAHPPMHSEPVAGICVSARNVAMLTKRGVVVWPVPVVEAWRHG
jgi:hypothetical protein